MFTHVCTKYEELKIQWHLQYKEQFNCETSGIQILEIKVLHYKNTV